MMIFLISTDRQRRASHRSGPFRGESGWACGRLNQNEDFEKIPSDPKKLNKSVIESAFKNLLYISTKRSDYYYLVIGRIHLAAALAYCGFNYDAKILLQNLLSESFATDFKDIINNALVSPTYSPTEGKIML